MTDQSLTTLLLRLWRHLNPRRHRQFAMLLLLMLLASFAEIISIGLVLPFLSVLTAPYGVFSHPAAQPFIQAFGITQPEQLLLPLALGFGAAALLSGAVRLLLLWANTRLSFALGADLGINIYRRTLYQPYAVHVGRNSSEIISGISGKANNVIYGVFLPTLSLINASMLLLTVLFAFLAFEPLIAISIFGGFGSIYLLVVWVTRKKLNADGRIISIESVSVIKALQEGLGGIRDIIIDGSQETYCQGYQKADLALRKAQGNSVFIASSPRYAVEALGMLLLAVVAYLLANGSEGVDSVIPVLGTFALGALRLLPILQQSYASWAALQSGRASLEDTLKLLDQSISEFDDQCSVPEMLFERHIRLKNVAFRYSLEGPDVLKNLNLTIPKGSRVGFVGVTGSGKSTLLDIIMGLLQPTSGALEVDGEVISCTNNRVWRAHIAHVPQSIFLADGTVEENIAFGIPKNQIDHDRVRLVAHQAQIAGSIETWPEKYHTLVGERGVRLSGGQRQRIGIARALYKKADVIILDEATSALDIETEQAVMKMIEELSVQATLLIIAHRLTTLRNCTMIFELDDGVIKRVGRYQDLVQRSKEMPNLSEDK